MVVISRLYRPRRWLKTTNRPPVGEAVAAGVVAQGEEGQTLQRVPGNEVVGGPQIRNRAR